MQLSALGDSALLIHFADESYERDALLIRAIAAAEAIRRAEIKGVLDVTSSYESVAVFLSATADAEMIEREVRQLTGDLSAHEPADENLFEIPVCYAPEFGLDLERVAAHTQLAPDEIVALHTAPDYRVAAIGFMPGFPYLAGLSPRLETPRLETPRVQVPAGSVGIAQRQTGIYPAESPGGWNIIGRTRLPLFDPSAASPSLLHAGDRVRFQPVTRAEFER
jgi:inhibitor of KinA